MRPPLSEIEPLSAGVSMAMRGEAASALVARQRRSARRARLRRAGCAAGLTCRARRSWLSSPLLLCRLGRLRRRQEELLPGEQHGHREHDGQDEVAVILVHGAFCSRAASHPQSADER